MLRSEAHPSVRYNVLILLALVLSSGLAVGLLLVRFLRTGGADYAFLCWNLLLAWIPFLFALLAYRAYQQQRRLNLRCLVYGLFWLLFLPNAPYLITDLVYLRPLGGVPLWYDLLLLLSFACNGLFLGWISLYLMQEIVSQRFGRWAGWFFALGALGLSGFGIYLGRFERWNSWDVFTRPAPLLADLWTWLRHPLTHRWTYAVSLAYAAVLTVTYLVLVALARMPRREPPRCNTA